MLDKKKKRSLVKKIPHEKKNSHSNTVEDSSVELPDDPFEDNQNIESNTTFPAVMLDLEFMLPMGWEDASD